MRDTEKMLAPLSFAAAKRRPFSLNDIPTSEPFGKVPARRKTRPLGPNEYTLTPLGERMGAGPAVDILGVISESTKTYVLSGEIATPNGSSRSPVVLVWTLLSVGAEETALEQAIVLPTGAAVSTICPEVGTAAALASGEAVTTALAAARNAAVATVALALRMGTAQVHHGRAGSRRAGVRGR
jgi:hypothetical protein